MATVAGQLHEEPPSMATVARQLHEEPPSMATVAGQLLDVDSDHERVGEEWVDVPKSKAQVNTRPTPRPLDSPAEIVVDHEVNRDASLRSNLHATNNRNQTVHQSTPADNLSTRPAEYTTSLVGQLFLTCDEARDRQRMAMEAAEVVALCRQQFAIDALGIRALHGLTSKESTERDLHTVAEEMGRQELIGTFDAQRDLKQKYSRLLRQTQTIAVDAQSGLRLCHNHEQDRKTLLSAYRQWRANSKLRRLVQLMLQSEGLASDERDALQRVIGQAKLKLAESEHRAAGFTAERDDALQVIAGLQEQLGLAESKTTRAVSEEKRIRDVLSTKDAKIEVLNAARRQLQSVLRKCVLKLSQLELNQELTAAESEKLKEIIDWTLTKSLRTRQQIANAVRNMYLQRLAHLMHRTFLVWETKAMRRKSQAIERDALTARPLRDELRQWHTHMCTTRGPLRVHNAPETSPVPFPGLVVWPNDDPESHATQRAQRSVPVPDSSVKQIARESLVVDALNGLLSKERLICSQLRSDLEKHKAMLKESSQLNEELIVEIQRLATLQQDASGAAHGKQTVKSPSIP